MTKTIEALNPTVGNESHGRYLGYTVSWDFEKADFAIRRGVIALAFEDAGFGEFIDAGEWDAGRALLAANRAGGGRNMHVETMERPNKDTPVAIGVYKKLAGNEMTGDDFECGARVRIDPATNTAVALPLEGRAVADQDCLTLAEKIADSANVIIENVLVRELSEALCRVGRRCLWANYREQGGTWFVYDGRHADKLRELLANLKKLSQKGFTNRGRPNYTFRPRVQPLHIVGNKELDALTEANIAESSEATLEGELAKLVKDLDKVKQDGMRASSIERRIDGCDELVARANLYKSMLKDAAADIELRIADVKAAFQKELNADAKTADQIDQVFGAIDAMVGVKPKRQRRKKTKKARSSTGKTLTEDELFSV